MSDADIPMERVTVRVPQEVLEEYTRLTHVAPYPNRSAALRDALRRFLEAHPESRVCDVDPGPGEGHPVRLDGGDRR